ncbi:hypothetical protein ACFO4P_15915 [Epilithonimonas pallida]|uniref:Uncharacterized protein n=1 Tax=Epilithonimonas pallida TaxID=373671 RepID=A0ABY1QY44_9FLAO|nr:hypothetical protein [Epilithonimonas pallida]SMP88574.1 hypothetical protein SAMN05421679_101520 [Epilithonimonas pallida]
MKEELNYRTAIFSCITEKLALIKEKYSALLEDCEVDFEKATNPAYKLPNYWGFIPDPDNPFEGLPTIVQSEVTVALRDCVDSHSRRI